MISFLTESEPIRRGRALPVIQAYLLSAKTKAPKRVLFVLRRGFEGDCAERSKAKTYRVYPWQKAAVIKSDTPLDNNINLHNRFVH